MKTRVKLRRVFGVIGLFALFATVGIGEAAGATYYSSPSGSGTACSSASPCSLTTGVGKLAAGDTLYLKNGTYNDSINFSASGTSANPITIQAENDGQAIVDGQNSRIPVYINGRSYINIEGIVAKNSSGDVVYVNYSNHINIRRVSAYNTADGNFSNILYYNSSYGLIEDCAASGRGRAMVMLYNSSHTTVRRCWGRVQQVVSYSSTGVGVTLYGSTDCIVENNIAIRDTSFTGTYMQGVNIFSNTYNVADDNNEIYGNIVRNANDMSYSAISYVHNLTGNVYKNNVAFDTDVCLRHAATDNLISENFTCVNASNKHYYLYYYDNGVTIDSDFSIGGTLKNSSFITSGTGFYYTNSDPYYGGLTHTYNNFYGLSAKYGGSASAGTGEKTLNPNYNTSTYGKGAYIMVPSALQGQGEGGADIGAEVLYRYQDGVLTSTPLWPWPMEDRILAETGVSVSYEANGGLWKTLDGVYTASTASTPQVAPAADTTPPSTPAGLTAASISSSQINLAWTASTDNVGVAGYKVYRGGTLIATVTGTNYSDTGLLPATTYAYAVSASDAAGNESGKSPQVSATTQPNIAPATVGDVIIDNGAGGTSYTGTWQVSYGGANPYGTDALYSNNGATYNWKATLPKSGKYAVYARWTTYNNRSTSAPYTVKYSKVTSRGIGTASTTINVNQQQNGGTWNYLGKFYFDTTKGVQVTLSASNPYPVSYCADAVKFVYLQ